MNIIDRRQAFDGVLFCTVATITDSYTRVTVTRNRETILDMRTRAILDEGGVFAAANAAISDARLLAG